MDKRYLVVLLAICSVILTAFLLVTIFPVWSAAYGEPDNIWDEDAHGVWRYLIMFSALPPMSPAEQSHMADVRALLWVLSALGIVCLVVFGRNIAKEKDWPEVLRHAGIALLAKVAVLAIIPFPLLFGWFHQIFFPQGNWEFSSESFLIGHFPFEFFTNFAFYIGLAIAFVGVAFVAVSVIPNVGRNKV